jgi:membrane associated rhomboid family serine protease
VSDITPVTLVLIAINVVVSMLGFRATGADRDRFVFIPNRVANGENIQGMLLSHLSHADAGHLMVNMLGLLFFGPVVERTFGSLPFLFIYVASGAAATAAIFLIRRNNPRFRALGASGSIAGVLFAAIVIRPDMNLSLMFLPIPVPAPLFAVLYIGISSYFAGRPGSRICHEAHIGGALAGATLAALMAPRGLAPLVARVLRLVS